MFLAVVAAACASADQVSPPDRFDVPETLALGNLPAPLSGAVGLPDQPTTEPPPTSTTVPPLRPLLGPIGEQVVGNRILLIGDAQMASTAARFDESMCAALETFEWAAEVNAEPGRVIDFGSKVLATRLDPLDEPPWDVAAIMFGNAFHPDLDAFRSKLDGLLQRLEPRPTIVYTVTDLTGDRAALNDVVRELPRFHPNIVVIDWAEVIGIDADGLIEPDGRTLTEAGSDRLALLTAGALGPAPESSEGECLPSAFIDDSAVSEFPPF
jgi:hypothetical protein